MLCVQRQTLSLVLIKNTAGFIKAQLILRLQQLIMCINNNFIYNYDAHIQSPLHLHSLSLDCGVL